jgi:hypothetical protein
MVLFKSKRAVIKRDKPIIVGFCILELSKLVMFQFHYDYMMPKYGHKRCRLCFFVSFNVLEKVFSLDVITERESVSVKDLFDLSNFKETVNFKNDEKGIKDYQNMKPIVSEYCTKQNIQFSETVKEDGSICMTTTHPMYDNTNNKKIINSRNGYGVMKIETSFHPMTDFIGLRSKMYSYEKEVFGIVKCDKRAKGVKKQVVKTEIAHKDYDNVQSQRVKTLEISQRGFRTYQHEIYTIEMKKSGLSAFDDKRFVLEDGKQTVAWGYKYIKKEDIVNY